MLCRACGEEMIAFKYCSDCKEVIQHICGSCKKEDEMSMHCHGRNNNHINLNFGQCTDSQQFRYVDESRIRRTHYYPY